MQILNRNLLTGPWPRGAIYVGRGTPLGNPSVIGEHGDRDEVLENYRAWLLFQIQQQNPVVLTALAGLKADSILVCSCAPKPCHAEIIAEVWASLDAAGGIIPRRPDGYRSMTYAGIGSRETPPQVLALMTRAAARLEARGLTLFSGGAPGADSAFDAGCDRKKIFLPWNGFNKQRSAFTDVSADSIMVAHSVHPAFGKLGDPVKRLMGRNSYQVLDEDLMHPVDFVLCWTPDGAEHERDRSPATGGTGQAISLADRWHVPVFNMRRPDALDRLGAFLRSNEFIPASA